MLHERPPDSECARTCPAVPLERIAPPRKIRSVETLQGLRLRLRLGLLRLVLPREDEEQPDTNANCAVRHIESWKTCFLPISAFEIEIKKIHHVPNAYSIEQVTQNPAEDQPQRNLSAE